MKLSTDIESILDRYGLASHLDSVTELKATHRALRIDEDGRSYALRQFNPYMTVDDFIAQFRLATALSEAGLPTPVPTPV